MGPSLVHHLEGSTHAKERLEVILQTIAGELTVGEACRRLGVGESMFHRLRAEALKASLDRLEPRARGRPAQGGASDERVDELERQIDDLAVELKTTEVKLDLAQVMPGLLAGEKKTTERKRRRKALARRQKQRRRKPR